MNNDGASTADYWVMQNKPAEDADPKNNTLLDKAAYESFVLACRNMSDALRIKHVMDQCP